MVVAGRSAHWKNGWFAQKGGIEVAAVYALLGLMLAVTGPGKLSLDAVVGFEDPEAEVPILLALGAAIGGATLILASRRPPEPPSEASQPSS
jgi:putative oxidoreductase